jgi:hypothetical protein
MRLADPSAYTGVVTDLLATGMRRAASAFLAGLTPSQYALANLPFTDSAARRWLEYRPRPRPGVCLADVDPAHRKAAHRLLATALSPGAYAQAMAVVALEEVLDRQEGGARGRHSGDYWVVVFGDPARDELWSWRFEGHHLSVAMTVHGDRLSPAPLFLGANPATVRHQGRLVLAPLAPEEDTARALLDALTPDLRARAITADLAPADIRSSVRPDVRLPIEPTGVAAGRLTGTARDILDQLVGLYLGRLPAELAGPELARLESGDLHFAWEGSTARGAGHYYRLQSAYLLIEYDNTDNDANHCHTVIRRPGADFGEDVLAAHRSGHHSTAARD